MEWSRAFAIAVVLWASLARGVSGELLQTADGFRGIWYANQKSGDEYVYKYSGGMATYPQQHHPIAIYSAEADKTFFVYGGTTAEADHDQQVLLHMVSYYDHATRQLARPRILLNKHTSDAHDNPTLQIDDVGHLWIFSPSHGTGRPSFIHRSLKPLAIDEFEPISETNFSYTQPWHVPGQGFLFLHTRYGGAKDRGLSAARCLFWQASRDGRTWELPQLLAAIEQGDYQISWRHGTRVATAFDMHPKSGGLNARANIYYLETADQGRTWQTAAGKVAEVPLTARDNAALILDSIATQQLVYLKDLNFDAAGHPVILYLTSPGYESGPKNDPRTWRTARWDGNTWVHRDITTSDNNYDHGSLYLEDDGTWRLIAPTEPGPQPYNPGGEMVMWTSTDQGSSWTRDKQLTIESLRNHTYARRPLNAHPDFYALWADGHGRQPSGSSLFFTNRHGDQVWRMPAEMTTDMASAEVVR
jgi:hypothetical protein